MKLIINEKQIDQSDLPQWAQSEGLKSEHAWIVDIAEAINTWYDKSDVVTISTSGSTGKPKMISHPKVSMKISASMTAERFDLRSGMLSYNCLPARYIAGKMMLIRAIIIGMDQICVEPKLQLNWPSNQAIDQKIDFAAMTPIQLSATLDVHPDFVRQIDQLIIGGAPISRSLMERIQLLNTSCHATYGMTETITHIASKPVNGLGKKESYEVLKGVKIDSINDNLVIRADHLIDSPIVTTDQVELLDQSNFIWIGRSDDVINRGGVKVHPAQIEKKLSTWIPQRFVISVEPDPQSGLRPALVIESSDGPYEKRE